MLAKQTAGGAVTVDRVCLAFALALFVASAVTGAVWTAKHIGPCNSQYDSVARSGSL
jgi:hypothetical protein